MLKNTPKGQKQDKDDNSKFSQMLQQFDAFFETEEEAGPELTAGLAGIVNSSLRRRPNDTTVKGTLAKYPVPANVPHLKVPDTNSDVMEALGKGPSILDLNIRKAQLAVSKAMIPVLHWMHDFGEGTDNTFCT